MNIRIVDQDEHDMLGDEAEALLNFLMDRISDPAIGMKVISYVTVLMMMNIGRGGLVPATMKEKLAVFEGYVGAMRASLVMNMRIEAGLEQSPVHNFKN